MSKLLIDAGTSWSKILEIYKDEKDLSESPMSEFSEIIEKYCIKNDKQSFSDNSGNLVNGRLFLLPTSIMTKMNLFFDGATGHMVKNSVKPDGYYENELIALGYGAKKMIDDFENATIVDLGSRDIKWIKFANGKFKDLDWNGTCGSATGATVEMLGKFYNVDSSEISPQSEKIPVTCGVFAMEKIMDMIISDIPPDIAIARYIHGIAYNTWNFAGQPEKIYLSGGFCANLCFIKSLKFYCETVPLGRFALLEGLF